MQHGSIAWAELTKRYQQKFNRVGHVSSFVGICEEILDYLLTAERELENIANRGVAGNEEQFADYFRAIETYGNALDAQLRDLMRRRVFVESGVSRGMPGGRVSGFIQRCGPYLNENSRDAIADTLIWYAHTAVNSLLLGIVPLGSVYHQELLVSYVSSFAFRQPACILGLPERQRSALLDFAALPVKIDSKKLISNYAETRPIIIDLAAAFQYFFVELGAAIAVSALDADEMLSRADRAIAKARAFFVDHTLKSLPFDDYSEFGPALNFTSILAAISQYGASAASPAWAIITAERLYAVQMPGYILPFTDESSHDAFVEFAQSHLAFAAKRSPQYAHSQFLRELRDLRIKLQDIHFELLPAERLRTLTARLLLSYLAASGVSVASVDAGRDYIYKKTGRDPLTAVELAAVAYVIFEMAGVPHAEKHAVADALIWFIEPSLERRFRRHDR